ncbi:MAG: SRPBCC family protein [Planctomycetaceae bacterium]|nr:SRPBCC family protein [Planctomycetaceae bacterium]
MKPVTALRWINAPLEQVFQTVADISTYANAVPHIVRVEFLTDQRFGVGTRFRETRVMNGKEASTGLEVMELVDNEHIRLVSDAGGTVWDSTFRVKSDGQHTELRLTMEIRPYRLLAKWLIPLIRKTVIQGVENDMDCVKRFCEQRSEMS